MEDPNEEDDEIKGEEQEGEALGLKGEKGDIVEKKRRDKKIDGLERDGIITDLWTTALPGTRRLLGWKGIVCEALASRTAAIATATAEPL